jgi:probable LLM family oxidoreductase
MEIGVDSFVTTFAKDRRTADGAERMRNLLDEIELSDKVGLDVFGIGEHHRKEFLDSAPPVILAAAAALTKRIRLTSAVTVLSAADPVRVFQEFATLDLISGGRAEMVAGRGSFVEAFPLFGYDLADYDELFQEKLELLLKIRDNEHVTWSGKFRPALNGEGVYPRPLQDPFPIWVGVGGTPRSFARAGVLGLPLAVAVIGGETHRFRPGVDLYREAWRRAGHPPQEMKVGLHSLGYVAESPKEARDDYFPGYARVFSDIGKERGWGQVTREDYDAQAGPKGALIIGDPEEVIEKIKRHSKALGGISRVTFQMDAGSLSHEKLMRSVELIGKRVVPAIHKEVLEASEGDSDKTALREAG